jgi:drug/metabolite transporter (DMT)-like permease
MTPDEHQAHRKNILIAILLTCVGYAFFNIGDAALKLTAGKFHFSQIFLLNSIVLFVWMAIYGWVKEGRKAFQTKKPKLMLLRASLAQLISLCTITALPHVNLTTFYTLVFTSPFWVALLSAWFMDDKLEKRRVGVILFGFLVVLFIFRPGGGFFNVWALLVLTSAFIYSCQMLIVRHLGTSESRPFMIMCGSTLSILISLPFLSTHFIWPTPYEWGLFLLMGTTGGVGLLCISYAFQSAPSASVIAPYHYTQIVWGALLGYFLFNEMPDVETMAGAALIILAGLYLVHSETRHPILRASGV